MDANLVIYDKDDGIAYYMDKEYKIGKRTTNYYWSGGRMGTGLHRDIFEAHIGTLERGDIVHHIDEDKGNNFPSNLERSDRSNHARHHYKSVLIGGVCVFCGKEFERCIPKNSTKYPRYCGSSCRDKAYYYGKRRP